MRKIVVGASKPSSFKIGAALIMWWEKTEASHVYVRLNVYDFRMVFQATGAGTQLINIDLFSMRNIPVYEKEIEVTDDQYRDLVKFINEKLGTKYSFVHLVGLFYKRLIQYVFNKIIKNPWSDGSKSEVCVEALARFIDIAKIKRAAEDPEDIGMFEAMILIKSLKGNELLNA